MYRWDDVFSCLVKNRSVSKGRKASNKEMKSNSSFRPSTSCNNFLFISSRPVPALKMFVDEWHDSLDWHLRRWILQWLFSCHGAPKIQEDDINNCACNLQRDFSVITCMISRPRSSCCWQMIPPEESSKQSTTQLFINSSMNTDQRQVKKLWRCSLAMQVLRWHGNHPTTQLLLSVCSITRERARGARKVRRGGLL